MTINEIANEIREWRISKGFETTKENMLGKLMLVVTELCEAAEDVDADNFAHLGEELADAMIRLMDIGSTLEYDLDAEVAGQQKEVVAEIAERQEGCDTSIIEELMRICVKLSKAAEDVRHERWESFGGWIAAALVHLSELCRLYAYEWQDEVARKMIVNAGRPYRHGTAVAV